MRREAIPARRGVADAKLLAHGRADAAPLDVGAGSRAGGREVLLFKEGGRQIERAEHPVALGLGLLTRLELGRRERLDLQVDAGRLGQVGQNVHERTLLDLDQEAYGITLFVAAEAVEELPWLVDGERGCFLAVKGAKPFPAPRSRPLELHMALDDIDDVGAVPNVVDLLPGY